MHCLSSWKTIICFGPESCIPTNNNQNKHFNKTYAPVFQILL